MRRWLLICLLCLALGSCAPPCSADPACQRILFIGNSYTYYNNLPNTFARLAQVGGKRVETGMAAAGGWTLTDHVERNLFLRRIPARMFVVLGPLMLVLAAIGIYAVVSYSVSRRTTEIGVRLALGATARRVVSQIVGETLKVVGAGALAGWLLMFMVALHLLGGVISLPVFVGVPAILLLVAALASWLPARRATSVDVMVALRQE